MTKKKKKVNHRNLMQSKRTYKKPEVWVQENLDRIETLIEQATAAGNPVLAIHMEAAKSVNNITGITADMLDNYLHVLTDKVPALAAQLAERYEAGHYDDDVPIVCVTPLVPGKYDYYRTSVQIQKLKATIPAKYVGVDFGVVN